MKAMKVISRCSNRHSHSRAVRNIETDNGTTRICDSNNYRSNHKIRNDGDAAATTTINTTATIATATTNTTTTSATKPLLPLLPRGEEQGLNLVVVLLLPGPMAGSSRQLRRRKKLSLRASSLKGSGPQPRDLSTPKSSKART